jgi:PP-loop superfamily ATP-utilizing enzyme
MKEELNKAIDMIDDGFLSMGIEHEFETLERMAYELLHFEFNHEKECYE